MLSQTDHVRCRIRALLWSELHEYVFRLISDGSTDDVLLIYKLRTRTLTGKHRTIQLEKNHEITRPGTGYRPMNPNISFCLVLCELGAVAVRLQQR